VFCKLPITNIYQWFAGAGVGLVFGSTEQQALDKCVQSPPTILWTDNIVNIGW